MKLCDTIRISFLKLFLIGVKCIYMYIYLYIYYFLSVLASANILVKSPIEMNLIFKNRIDNGKSSENKAPGDSVAKFSWSEKSAEPYQKW